MKKSNLILIISALMAAGCATNPSSSESSSKESSSSTSSGSTQSTSSSKSGSTCSNSDRYEEGYGDGYSAGRSDGYEEGQDANAPVYSIHTSKQDEYLKGPVGTLPSGINGLSENSLPNPITINVAEPSKYNGQNPTKYILVLSKDRDFGESEEYEAPGSSSIFTLKHLNIATRYYYKHKVVISGQTREISGIKSFYVDGQAPRNVYIDGVTNCRDVGGWKIEGSEKRTVQGLLYRTGRMHDDLRDYITPAGIETFAELGIKSEIDLRDESTDNLSKHSSAVPGVDYYYCPINNQSYITDSNNRASWKKAFKTVSDVHNYPLSFHCAIGTDRTGFFAYILNSLAGVGLDDLKRDYMFSCFGNINGVRSPDTIANYANQIDAAYGGHGDRKLGSENFLKSSGLTQGEIDSIKEILTGEKHTHTHIDDGEWAPSEVDDEHHVKVCGDPSCGVVLHKEKHQFGELAVDKEPTATEDGYGHRICDGCHYRKEEIIKHSSKDFDVVRMKDYGGGKSFSLYVDCDEVESLDMSKSSFNVLINGVKAEGALVSFTPKGSMEHPLLNVTLKDLPEAGDVITLGKNSVLASSDEDYVLVRDMAFTFNGTLYAPSFYLGSFSTRKASPNVELEFKADFTDFTGGQAADGLQPYYTSTDKGKIGHYIYTLTHGGTTYTVTNDNHDLTGTLTTKTQMFWVSAHLLRVSIPMSYLADGDVFTLKKGSIYADNGGHAGHVNDVKRYILDRDVVARYNGATGKFEEA